MQSCHPLRSAVLALLTGLLWCCLTAAALAHASLTGTVPADGAVLDTGPKMLQLSFSEPVSPLVLKLVGPDGAASRLDNVVLRDRTLDITPPSDLADGTYIVTWRVVSQDGHPVAGSMVFSIGAPSASAPMAGDAVDWPVRSALWLARIGLYAGLAFGIGGAFASCWLVPGGNRPSRTTLAAIALGFLSTALSAGLLGLDALGLPLSGLSGFETWKAGFGTSFGPTVIVLAGGFVLAFLSARWTSRALRRSGCLAALAMGGLALALSGHASAAPPQWLTRPSVFLHATTIAIWIGALLPLASSLWQGGEGGREALTRFSCFIPVAVVLLALAGIVLAVIQVGEPAALLSTPYGNVLLFKLVLLAALFSLIAVNRWILTRPAEAGEATATRRLVRAIALESVVVLLIFAVAAAWRFTPPPRALAIAAAQPLSAHIHSDKAMAEVTISPGRAGPVEVSAIVLSADFAPMTAKEVVFVVSKPDAGIEPMRRKAMLQKDGAWRAEGFVLSLPGRWTVRLDILVSDFELVRLQDALEIKP